MKRFIIATLAFSLAAIMLAGCVSVKPVKVEILNTNIPAKVTSAPTPAPKALTRGVIEGSVYTNESAELMFTAPEGWEYATDEAIGAIAGTGAGASDGTNTCDMIAIETATNTTVMVAYAEENIFHDEEAFIDSVIEWMKENPRHNVEFGSYTDYYIGPHDFKAMTIYYKDQGFTQYYYARRAGNYMLCIIATITGNNDIDTVMANFSATENASVEKLKRGTFAGNVYSSDYNGITFTAPEDWEYRTDGELSDWSHVSAEEFAKPGCEYSGEALRKSSVYDMAVRDIFSSTNISIAYENLTMCSEGTGINMEQYIDNIKGFSAADGVEFGDVYDTVLCGQTYTVLTMITAEKNLNQYLYFRRIDKYMLIIVVSVFGNDNIDDVLGCFS